MARPSTSPKSYTVEVRSVGSPEQRAAVAEKMAILLRSLIDAEAALAEQCEEREDSAYGPQ
jgi:hypothetical protein